MDLNSANIYIYFQKAKIQCVDHVVGLLNRASRRSTTSLGKIYDNKQYLLFLVIKTIDN